MPIPNVRPSTYSSFGYRAASVARRGGRTLPTGGSGDYHARTDADLLRNLAQEMDRDNAIYSGILNRAADNILGDGFQAYFASFPNATLEDMLKLMDKTVKDLTK